MKTIYPAIFMREEKDEYSVIFPDLEGCVTCGDNLEHALSMAEEALGLYLVSLEERKLPAANPSDPAEIKTENNDFVSLISTSMERYRRNKAVKKTLTIPQWLNDAATEKA